MAMPWDAIAGGLQGWNHGYVTRKEVEANSRLSDLNAKEGNKIKQAGNAAEAAHNSLDRWVQSVNNNRVLRAGGEALATTLSNARRETDATLTQSFSDSIKDAEQQGAARAAQASAGVDGNVVDQINGSIALRNDIVKQQLENFGNFQNHDIAERAGSITSQMIGGLNSSLILDTFDYNIDVAKHESTMNNWAYMLRGMAEHMGGGGSVDSGLSKEKQREKELDAEKQKLISEANARERASNDGEDHTTSADADKYKFGYKYASDFDEYDPYSIDNDTSNYYSGDF